MGEAWAGLRLAVGTLTVVPVGELAPTTRRIGGWSMALAPLAALPLGLLVALLCWLGHWAALPSLLTGALVVGALAVGTRAMHLDGLADTVDGIGAGWDRERALRIMRTGDAGPMGVAALVIVALIQVATLATLVTLDRGWLLAGTAVLVSRSAATIGCLRGLPAAEGSRLGALVAGTVPRSVAAVSVLAGTAALSGAAQGAGLPWWQGAAAMLALSLVVAWLLRTAVRVFGGISGDVLGAAIELGLSAILIVLVVGVSP